MAFSPAALLSRFRRSKAQDPFGGDDLFDGESRFAGQGLKIALIASGVLFFLLIGGVALIVATGDNDAAPAVVVGSLADLEIVEEADEAAAADTAETPASDATAATDRSASRRPWLAQNGAGDAPAPRPGMSDTAKTEPPARAAVVPADAKSDQKAPEVKAVETKPAVVKPPETKAAETKVAETKTADAKPAAVMAPPAATTPSPAPAKEAVPAPTDAPSGSLAEMVAEPTAAEPAPAELDPTRDIAGIPALQAAGQAPGAPRRFDAPTGEGAATVAGGRPRLVEPPLPPTDKVAVSAPPPRYANLTDVKRDAGTPAPAPNATKVAFIVDGLGLSQSATDAAIDKLPAEVTLAFSPYARDLKKWMEKAKEKGHEVLIEVPMESKQFPAEDPGPLGLLTSAEAKENEERLDTILKEATNAIGVLDTMGSKFRESGEHINPVFGKLKQSNLFYVQGTPGVRVGEPGIPTAVADVVLDERPFRAAVDARLDYAERIAKYQGSAVVSMGAKPVNFERMVLWIEQAQKKGIVLAPISQVLIKQ